MIGADHAAAFVTLNRPEALNALTTAMRAAMARAFPRWARDPEIYAVVVSSASERAFCAGGDVREITEWAKNRKADAVKSLAEEYAHAWPPPTPSIPCWTIGTRTRAPASWRRYGRPLRVASRTTRWRASSTGCGPSEALRPRGRRA